MQLAIPCAGACKLRAVQRGLDPETDERLKQFEAFVSSVTKVELRQTREKFVRLRKNFATLKILDQAEDENN